MIRRHRQSTSAARLASGAVDARIKAVIKRVAPFTMTSPERVAALYRAVEYCVDQRIPGAFVECGVWRGGSAMTMALVLGERHVRRELALFDTFTGMVEPEEIDVDLHGLPPTGQWSVGALAVGLEDVRSNLLTTGYEESLIAFVEGPVEETLPARAPEHIALLRLDTDWYASTHHELTHLYPRLSPGGVLIIDDYGHWSGAKAAVDDYFSTLPAPPELEAIDYTGRLCIKS